MIADDPVIYTAEGRALRCSEAVAMRGGWQNVSAEEATALAQLGCYPGFIDGPDVSYTGGAEVDSFPATYPEVQDLYTAPTVGDVGTSPAAASNAPINQPDANFSEVPVNFSTDPSGYDDPNAWSSIAGVLPSALNTYAGLQDTTTTIEKILGQVSDMIPFNQQNQFPQVTVNAGWAHCLKQKKRQRVRIAVMPDGSRQVVPYCRPRRMNPLNPRALRRAASRLGSFHRIASHIEKLVQKACKTGSRRRAPMRFASSCAPKRCR